MAGASHKGQRCVAIVGPYLSGKTSLLEAMLHESGAIARRGRAKDRNTVGDSSPEARERGMSVELNIVGTSYLGDSWALLDSPGSVEFRQDALAALTVADIAVVVCEPESAKVMMLTPVMKYISDIGIPAILFINKIDTATETVRELMEALQSVAVRPLVLRHVPIRRGEGSIGYVDLVSERAYQYEEGRRSRLIEIPATVQERNDESRQELLESLADFDDDLLERLLEDEIPETGEVYNHLARDLQESLIMPVLIGSAEQSSGVKRLLKLLRHEAPDVEATLTRKLEMPDSETLFQVFKTQYQLHAGKMSYARIWRGNAQDGMQIGASRIRGINRPGAGQMEKVPTGELGEVVALGRMEDVKTGQALTPDGHDYLMDWPEPLSPVHSSVVLPERWEDEVKLSSAVARLIEEDPSLERRQNELTGETVIWGQGETHIQVMAQKLKSRFNANVYVRPPATGYQETIRRGIEHHARHKKQSGGHGEFGDVHLRIKPEERGTGIAFSDTISGGVVPKQYIPAVETGVREYSTEGPLGFPVTDISVTLYDGRHHSVDSSDMAFRKAGILAMKEALPKCSPVLLEPICMVRVTVPNQFTSNAQGIVTKRRGQILGFVPKDGWQGWDEIEALMPQSELQGLIIELRSQTMGLGTYVWEFERMSELSGRIAEIAIEQSREAKK